MGEFSIEKTHSRCIIAVRRGGDENHDDDDDDDGGILTVLS